MDLLLVKYQKGISVTHFSANGAWRRVTSFMRVSKISLSLGQIIAVDIDPLKMWVKMRNRLRWKCDGAELENARSKCTGGKRETEIARPKCNRHRSYYLEVDHAAVHSTSLQFAKYHCTVRVADLRPGWRCYVTLALLQQIEQTIGL